MASEFVCRLCCSTAAIKNRRYKQLFSSKSLQENIPGRLSIVLDLPVSDSDGLSKIVCLICMKKVESIEAFRLLARHSYQKQAAKLGSPVRSAPKKRTKDTSGSGASPFTVSSRPSAKRSTIGMRGKRLAFSPVQSRKFFNVIVDVKYLNILCNCTRV